MLLPLLPVGAALLACTGSGSSATFDWRQDWEVRESFDLAIDSSGFRLPTAIAFVQQPATEDDAALYFVTELRGTIKVVTNDRRVRTFAEVSALVPRSELPDPAGEGGLAGLCLDAAHGYVFVTYTARDQNGLMRNRITRFETAPRTFALRPERAVEIGAALAREPSAISHQIGGCRVAGDALYVGVGDGGDPRASQQPERLLGKVVRLTLDGAPYPGNPLPASSGADADPASAPVWAYGLRNPFGIAIVDGEVFVADNGPSLDRFLRVPAGLNALWDGSDASIAALADVVFPRTIGPVQLERHPPGAALFPEPWRSSFFAATSARANSGVVAIPYDLAAGRADGTPAFVVRRRGPALPAGIGVAGLAFGPDGLYFAALLANEAGETHVLRLAHDAASTFPFVIGRSGSRLQAQGCTSCHAVGGEGGQLGPPLDFELARRSALLERLGSEPYRERQSLLDTVDAEPFSSTRALRAEVREADGEDQLRR